MAPVTDRVAMVCRAASHGRFRRAMAIATGRSPRPTPCRARPMINTVKPLDTAASTQPTTTAPRATRMTGPLAGPVGQPPHHRRGQGAGQQGDGEDPLPGAQRHPVVPRQGGDEGRAEARHHGHQGPGQHQGRYQEPPAQRRAVTGPDRVRRTDPRWLGGRRHGGAPALVIRRCHWMMTSGNE